LCKMRRENEIEIFIAHDTARIILGVWKKYNTTLHVVLVENKKTIRKMLCKLYSSVTKDVLEIHLKTPFVEPSRIPHRSCVSDLWVGSAIGAWITRLIDVLLKFRSGKYFKKWQRGLKYFLKTSHIALFQCIGVQVNAILIAVGKYFGTSCLML